jgi:hypothetical protein
MSFDMNPADEDPHGECRYEIQRLQNENRLLKNTFGPPGSPCPWKDTGELVDEVAALRARVTELLGVCRALPLDCEFTDAADFKDHAGAFTGAMELARAAIAKEATR